MAKRKHITTVLAILLTIYTPSCVLIGSAEGAENSINRPSLLEQVKHAILFLGHINDKGEPEFRATGFLIRVASHVYLVTAKHVVVDRESGKKLDEKMHAFFNSQTGTLSHKPLANITKLGFNWVFHENPAVDIALLPFLIVSEDNLKNIQLITVQEDGWLDFQELQELEDVFFISYQPEVQINGGMITSVVRRGMVSLKKEDKSFYIDGAAFPGNSGSPVFLKPSINRSGSGFVGSGESSKPFIGLIGEYIPYRDIAVSQQTKRPRVVFEENTGLSRVWSTDLLRDVLTSKAFIDQQKRLEELRKKAIEAQRDPEAGQIVTPNAQ
ncbi:MAG: hypothetical protein COV75_03055 [Candidatus Omnitrophica bacterium CG11_big_fil_rev_8_21_14_0_20_63_9]|nr:MAG: hypothetical protein COV75_03055 [Candidatus Omnitrophica bacterium CG11_big_fil_rev_8_21_14_0_20_63_9]